MAEITTITVREAIDEVKQQFGEEGDVQITDAHVIRWINRGAREMAIRTKYLQETVTTDLLADVATYDFATDSGRLMNIDSVQVSGNPVGIITVVEADRDVSSLDPQRQNSAPVPSRAWIDNGVLHLHPKPSMAVTGGLRIKYIAYPEKVTDAADLLPVPDRLYNTILSFCLAQAQYLDADHPQAKQATEEFEQSMARQSQLQNAPANSMYAQIQEDPDDYAYDSGYGF